MLTYIPLLLLFIGQVDAQEATHHNHHCASGRHTIVHLFEWKWNDIKTECETFLGPYGYCGVQISPPSENAVVTNPNRPWWERYQPVSYNLTTRSGTEDEFRAMVNTCNQNNVRIYADAVINHMTGTYSGTGTGGSRFNGLSCDYPGVPYSRLDCNGFQDCHSSDGSIHNYNDPAEVRNCKLLDLEDLKLGTEYVRGKVVDYMNRLLDMGVAGFRIDAAKHMWPGDLAVIFARLKDLNTAYFPAGSKAFIFQEVVDMGKELIHMSEYFKTGVTTDFIYGSKMADIFLRHADKAKYLQNWGQAWGMPNGLDALVFINNHANQRRHDEFITFFTPKELKISTAFMLAHPYGFPRIMSSFRWNRNFENGDDKNSWEGPPHNADMTTSDVTRNSDLTCGGGWVCEHRWRQIYNMVAFRNVVVFTPVQNWWSQGDFQIAFSRGNKGFIAINAEAGSFLNATLNTGLPQGSYCDVISGNLASGKCTGSTINVSADGHAQIMINGTSDDPVVAIHIGAKIGSPKKITT